MQIALSIQAMGQPLPGATGAGAISIIASRDHPIPASNHQEWALEAACAGHIGL